MTQPNVEDREVLVTGARGKTGREVVAQLAERGVSVRAGSSAPGQGAGTVRPVLFDWEEPATWREAVAGVDAVYLMRPDLEAAPDLVAGVVELQPQVHVVLLSEQGAGDYADPSWERSTERAVTEQARSWTLLRPSWFHQVLTDPRYYLDSIRDDGVLPLSGSPAKIAFVDARDIAAVAVAALLDPDGHSGAAYEITGPEGLSTGEVGDILAASLGRPVVAADAPVDDSDSGLPPWLADQWRLVMKRVSEGVFAQVTDDVERVTGRPPISVASFAEEYADVWRLHA
jgi:uncharacterized protein YbjT (DUF2867 family)